MQKQMGLDLEYTDPTTHALVPWARPTQAMLKEIGAAPWKLVDIETTGLNPASKECKFTGKDLRRGVDPELRQRVNTVLYPTPDRGLVVVSFDFDELTKAERKQVARACLNNVVIAHNAGFDGFWLRKAGAYHRPSLLLDTMLMARVLVPDQPLRMAAICNDETAEPELRAYAELMFKAGRSGWALADLSAGILGKLMAKGMQGPKNWAEPFLSQKHYDYATDDVWYMLDVLLDMFGLTREEVTEDPMVLLDRYYELRESHPALAMIEPQVLDVIEMREHGIPWDPIRARTYVDQQWQKVAEAAAKMVTLEPALAPFQKVLQDPTAGISADLKAAMGQAFIGRGIELELTTSTGAFKIGEKDLRRAKAALSAEAKELFDTWVKLNKAKKAGGMALEVSGYAQRADDLRLHPNTGHGPVTGRLSSSEPNCQQFPRDQGFRDCVAAPSGYMVVAADFSALDMRVGAALAIRAQRQIAEAYMGDRSVEPDVLLVIQRVLDGRVTLEQARAEEARLTQALEEWNAKREELANGPDRSKYWDARRKKARRALLGSFQRCLKEVRDNADAAGTPEWGSLRNAFSIAGMDIHTWTALGMLGKDPGALFGGLPPDEVAKALKHWKGELGDHRQTGKVGNLSLLYAMKDAGLAEAAAKNYNIHWTLEEANKVRKDWLAAYVEIDLWHRWTELTPYTSVYVPDPDRGGKYVKKDVFQSVTLGNRLIYAFGLNAALSYEDQSTGADILGRVMSVLRTRVPDIFDMTINQVHDELVLLVPADRAQEVSDKVGDIMRECAEHFLMQYGVHADCSPAVGDVWLKD